MADIDLTQEADALIKMQKHCVGGREWKFPTGRAHCHPIDVARQTGELYARCHARATEAHQSDDQNRARQAFVLIRLDIDGPPHRNPNDEEIACPHLHVYREGYADKWAITAPAEIYSYTQNLFLTFEAFMNQCNVTQKPRIQQGLF